ncbi:MAG: ribonuclease HI family protein [Tepidisphaerales bacterium]
MGKCMREQITLEFDGGSRGNPGPAGAGVVLRAADGTALVTLGRFLGRATNNSAEYRALILGLEKAKELGATRLEIRGDSELIIRQMKGEYRVKHPELRELYEQAQLLLHDFTQAKFEHRLRQHNSLADRLANLAMDRKGEVTEADDSDLPPEERASSTRWRCGRCGCEIEVRRPPAISVSRHKPFVCACGTAMLAG